MAEISKQALLVANNVDFPNNNAGAITPAILRSFNTDMIDSTVNQTQYNTNSGSWNISISALNTFTSSQQPQFTNLNAFTASQLTINSGYNATTQSLSASISSTNVALNQVIAWTGSVNAISFNGGAAQYSKRLNFGGFISASFVPNVGGLIADINVLQDPSKLNTSSFNAYTQSQAIDFANYSASQAQFNTSATSSISQLLTFSSSLDATYATDAQLAAVSASLDASKLNKSSFNSYTQSISNAGYATTGSNTFRGDQLITGSITLGNGSFLKLTPSSSAGYNSAIKIYTKPSGSTPEYYLNIQPVPGFAGNAVAIANFSNGGDVHFMTFDLDNTITNIETALYTSGPITTTNTYPGITLQSNLAGSGSAFNITTAKVDNTTDPANVFSAISLADDHTGVQVGVAFNSYTPYYASSVPMFYGGENYNNSDAAIILPGNTIEIVKPTSFKAPVATTGSVLGNITPLTIASNTASMDLSLGNFFSLTLVSGSTTRLNPSNIKQGQTINLLVTQAAIGTGSLSYNSTFKFPAGNAYVATQASGSKDIITFVTFDNSTIYAAAINNLL